MKKNFTAAKSAKKSVNVAKSTSKKSNVAKSTSKKTNITKSTSMKSKMEEKKRRRPMKLDESFAKRITKNGQFRVEKFKVEEIENVINMANDLLQSVIEYNKTKNVNKVISICQKYNLSDEEFEVFVAKYAEMKTAA